MANNLTEFGRKNQALNINATCRYVQLHTGNPGIDGQANKLGSPQSVVYDGNDAKLRTGLSEATTIPEFAVAAGNTITHVTLSTADTSTEATLVYALATPIVTSNPTTVRVPTIQIQTL